MKKPTVLSLTRKLRATERALAEKTARLTRATERERRLYTTIADLRDGSSVPDFDAVMSAARKWHYSEVRSIADEAIAELNRHRLRTKAFVTGSEARDWLTEWVDQSVDGHQHVIYTGQAVMLLAASDNDDAYEAETGEPSGDTSARACYALRTDVWDLLNAREDEWAPVAPEGPDDPDGSPGPESDRVVVELVSPVGPRAVYVTSATFREVTTALPAGWVADFSNQVETDSGRFSVPLVRA